MKTIGTFTPTALDVSLDIRQIVTLHYMKYSRDFMFTGEKHDFWEAVYVDKGEIGVLAESNGIDLYEGEAIFHKPNEYHNIWAKNQYANVAILTFVCHSPAMSFFENKILRFGDGERELLAKILSLGQSCFAGALDMVDQTKLEVAKTMPFAGLQSIKNYLELLLISLVQNQTGFSQQNRFSLSAKREGENTIVGSIRQMLNDNVYGSVTLENIVQQMCFSKTYLTSLFRKHTGSSVMEYYTDLKIAEAQKLISERELSVSAIADRLSFGSVHYFCRLFKKKTRMTPLEYRNSVQSRAVL
jgi:AraC-like DNA-binding protein